MKKNKIILTIFLIIISLSLYSQLYISNLSYFVMDSLNNSQVVLSDMNFKNLGTFSAGNGTVVFAGSTNDTILGNNISFNNLKINKNNSDVSVIVGTDFDVDGNLELSKGDLDLQNSIVSLGTTGIIVNETEANRIKVGDTDSDTGTITIDRTINNSTYTYSDLSNIGIYLETDKNLGNITIVRGHKIQTGMGHESIERYYIIPGIGEIDSGTNYIEMLFFDVELNGLSDLQFFQTVSYGSEWWTPCFTTIASNVATFNNPEYDNWIYEHSVSFDDKFTLASKDYPLPVELLDFGYDCENSTLNWTTSSETNNDYFTIEKSYDLIEWEITNKIFGQGNTNIEHSYVSIMNDNNVYYRLCQHDYDGSKTCYNVIYVDCDTEDSFVVYPTPVNRNEYLNICCGNIESLKVTNMLGQEIDYERSNNSIKISTPGTYIVAINKEIKKIIVH